MLFNRLIRLRWSYSLLPLLSVSLSLYFIFPLPAKADTTGDICHLRCMPKTQVPPFVEIDANTGEVLNGSTSFAEGEKVQVILSHMNPYKYEYDSQIKSSPLDISIVSAFLNLIPGASSLSSLFPALPPTPTVTSGGAPAAIATTSSVSCPSIQSLTDASKQLESSYNASAATAKALEISYKAYEKFVLATDKDSLGSEGDCEMICKQGGMLVPDLSRITDLKDFKDQLAKLQQDATSLGKAITDYESTNPGCLVPDLFKQNVAKATSTAMSAQATVAELDKAKPAIELLSQRIAKTLADDNSFSSVHYPYTQGEPTGVQITLFRKNLREEGAKDVQAGQVQLTVGQSRFSLSAGVGFSTIQDVTIVKEGDKFAEENKSDLRPSLTTTLNAQLGKGPWSRSTWGISTGLVLTSRDNATEVEYIVGPNFGLLDNRFFIVLGYHAARVQSLRSKDIPADSQEIPVVKVWKSGAMLAFTYKIR